MIRAARVLLAVLAFRLAQCAHAMRHWSALWFDLLAQVLLGEAVYFSRQTR